MKSETCESCGHTFTSRERWEGGDADAVWQRWSDISEGDYVEWDELRCPRCEEIVDESGR